MLKVSPECGRDLLLNKRLKYEKDEWRKASYQSNVVCASKLIIFLSLSVVRFSLKMVSVWLGLKKNTICLAIKQGRNMDHQLDKNSLTTNLFKEFVLQTTVFNTT